MEHLEFEKLIQIQAEIADQIMELESEIDYYSRLEKDMVQKRNRQLHKSALGYKDDKVETGFAIHYIQVKLHQKKGLYEHLTNAFQNRTKEYVQVLQTKYQ